MDFAREFHTTIKDLYVLGTQDEYRAAGCMECCGEFSCNENKTLILELLDIYCDVQEMIAEAVITHLGNRMYAYHDTKT